MNTLSTLGQQYEILSSQGIQEEVSIKFDGGVNSGAIGTLTLFTVTGLVKAKVIAICEQTLVGAGTIELGTTINTAGLIAQIADATTLATGEIWHDATPDASVELVTGTTSYPEKFVNQDIKLKIGTAAITAGRIRIVVQWAPVTRNSKVVSLLPITSASPSMSPSSSASPSASASPSSSVSVSASVSPSSSASRSLSPSSSVSPSSSASRSLSPSASASASLSPSSSVSQSLSPSASASASLSPSSSASRSASPSSSISPSLSPSPL